MDYKVNYNSDLNAVVAVTAGNMTARGIARMIDQELLLLDEFKEASLISDHTESNAGGLSADDIWNVSQYCLKLSSYLEGKKLAVVLIEDLDYGLGRMWKSFTEVKVPFEIQLFRCREEAEAWIAE